MKAAALASRPPCREMFRADWREALFIHFRVDVSLLRRLAPLPLDLFGGEAYVSLVAFTQANLRPSFGGAATAWLSRPLSTHGFLNLRTYVRHGEERGIYFLSEWIPNALAAFLGPRLYGLPYRLGELDYATKGGVLTRNVACGEGAFRCRAEVDPACEPRACEAGSAEAFLLERYTAFTFRRGVLRRFRIRHEPWLQAPARVEIQRGDLIGGMIGEVPAAAQFSWGVRDVAIGLPERLEAVGSRCVV